MIALIMGPVGKLIVLAALALSLLGIVSYGVHQYNDLISARITVAEQAATMDAMRRDHDVIMAAMDRNASEATTRLASAQAIKGAIANAPSSNACSGSAAVRAAVDGLRSTGTSRNPGSANANP